MVASKSIKVLLDHFNANELILPEIQREFVWKRRQIKNLFDSLYRVMPIGSLLVWKAMTRVHQKPRAGQSKVGGVLNSMYGYLLDGQQRLTALLHVKDGDDDYPLMMYLWPDEEEDEDEEKQTFYWAANWTKENPWCIPVAEALKDNFKSLEYIERLKHDEDFKDRHAQPVLDRLDRLRRILNYEVSIIEYESDSYEEAKELFITLQLDGDAAAKDRPRACRSRASRAGPRVKADAAGHDQVAASVPLHAAVPYAVPCCCPYGPSAMEEAARDLERVAEPRDCIVGQDESGVGGRHRIVDGHGAVGLGGVAAVLQRAYPSRRSMRPEVRPERR